MKQIVDLQNDPRLGQRDVQLVSLASDSVGALYSDSLRLGIDTPFLSDPESKTSRSYGLPIQNYYGEPGHIFVLVGKDGTILWVKDYAIPGKNPVMYVNPNELDAEIAKSLPSSGSR